MKVLVAEDDPHIREGLVAILHAEGYSTITAANGTEAWDRFRRERADLVCLDVMMPGLSGYDVCRKIRQLDAGVPLIFISAKSEEIDRVLGLELGADDYVVKPFGVREVVARIRAVTRRFYASRESRPTNFTIGDLDIAPAELRARRGATVIDLSLRDVKILQLLYERRGEAVSRDELFDRCWGLDHVPNSRTLDQHVSQLRKRIEVDAKAPRIIATVHGVGYRYEG